ncbi:MAG: hypothetical protein CMF31_02740 [Kordiimonas sp.]|nr:hypothetical protein [Kordiimonas sp.]
MVAGCSSSGTSDPSSASQNTTSQNRTASEDETYDEESIGKIASDWLGAGAESIGKVIEKAFKDHGRPNGYILGTEGSGALIIGLRYGDGELVHKIEGNRPVYWKGPSLGPDIGGNASKTFTLVYNLYDVEELFQRFPGVEGSIYYVAGITMNYQRKEDIILAPIRLGAGLRLGANLGYVHYTKKRDWIPF